MSEENEILKILKVLVEKIKTLEETVYDQDNVLMKSGLVRVEGLRPTMSAENDGLPDADTIAKMSWDDLNAMVNKIEG
mgnify:CR=1 FL=1